jgi:transketolase
MAENGIGKKLIRIGIPGCYAHGASRQYLQAEYKMDSKALVDAIGKLCHKNIAVTGQIDANKPISACAERTEDL